MYYVWYFSFKKHKYRYLNCPIFQQCLWHTRSTTFLNFVLMFLTHQYNLIIQFSDNVCDKSDELCHCIIPFSDNVRDISGQLPCQIFWQCVWHIRTTVSSCIIPFSNNVCDISGQIPCKIFWQCVWLIRRSVSLYHPIFRQCPWSVDCVKFF